MKERGGSWFGESPHWARLQMFRYVGHLQRAALEPKRIFITAGDGSYQEVEL